MYIFTSAIVLKFHNHYLLLMHFTINLWENRYDKLVPFGFLPLDEVSYVLPLEHNSMFFKCFSLTTSVYTCKLPICPTHHVQPDDSGVVLQGGVMLLR